MFPRGFFMGLSFFLVGISGVQIFPRKYFMGPKDFLVDVS